MIWKGRATARSDEPDRIEDAISDLVRAAQGDVRTGGVAEEDRGELIEWEHGFAFILHVPSGTAADVAVEVASDRLKAGSLDFVLERRFPVKVDPSTATSTCVNGVLSVRVSKAL